MSTMQHPRMSLKTQRSDAKEARDEGDLRDAAKFLDDDEVLEPMGA